MSVSPIGGKCSTEIKCQAGSWCQNGKCVQNCKYNSTSRDANGFCLIAKSGDSCINRDCSPDISLGCIDPSLSGSQIANSGIDKKTGKALPNAICATNIAPSPSPNPVTPSPSPSPSPSPCPKCPSCPTNAPCPSCPTNTPCPSCPTSKPCPLCDTCPTCGSCPTQKPCSLCKECPVVSTPTPTDLLSEDNLKKIGVIILAIAIIIGIIMYIRKNKK
jgi:hypothetical protein